MPSIALAILREAAVPEITDIVPGDPEFLSMVKGRRRELHALTKKLAKGEITVDQWGEAMEGVLLEGHTRGAYYGRMLAMQKQSASELVDVLAGQAALDSETYYLRGFYDALRDKDPRYWDAEAEKWLAGAIEDRQDMYLHRIRGTANAAFLRESPGFFFDWVLGGVEDHCTECPDLAALSPWGSNELYKYPGSNETPCLFNCRCFLKREDDVIGFKPIDL